MTAMSWGLNIPLGHYVSFAIVCQQGAGQQSKTPCVEPNVDTMFACNLSDSPLFSEIAAYLSIYPLPRLSNSLPGYLFAACECSRSIKKYIALLSYLLLFPDPLAEPYLVSWVSLEMSSPSNNTTHGAKSDLGSHFGEASPEPSHRSSQNSYARAPIG